MAGPADRDRKTRAEPGEEGRESEEQLDEGLEETFPASDPPAASQPVADDADDAGGPGDDGGANKRPKP